MPKDPMNGKLSETSVTGRALPPLRLFDVIQLGELVFESSGSGRVAEVAVIISLYNYEAMIVECLESVASQDLEDLTVTVVDDCSSDGSAQKAIDFLKTHEERFARSAVVRHHRNQGLAMSRNSGIAWTREPYLFVLDADNRIRPPALSRLREALRCSGAAFAYSQLRLFGDQEGIGAADVWDPAMLAWGNYIDAMALIRREALFDAGGYAALAVEQGWEDYDLWCRFAELGLEGVFVPELLCEYRVHGASMLRTRTDQHIVSLMLEMSLRHPNVVKGPIADLSMPWPPS